MANKEEVEYDLPPAPPILILEDHEKFRDVNGKPLEIEVRGERNVDKVYFKVHDVAKAFEMDRLMDTLTQTNSAFIDKEDFTTFITIIYEENDGNELSTNTRKFSTGKAVYLTYNGMLHVLYASRNKNARRFQRWASEKLFTIHMGTREGKEALAANVLGVSIKDVKNVFSKSANAVSGVYLFALNTVKELRNMMNIPDSFKDDDIVYKYGMTKDLERRSVELQNDLGKNLSVTLGLKLFTFVDANYISDAEIHLRNVFQGMNMKLEYENRAELVIISQSKFPLIKDHYNTVSNLYAGSVREIIEKLKQIEMHHAYEIERKNSELIMKEKDLDFLKRDHNKDLQVKDLQLELKDNKIHLLESQLDSLRIINDLKQKLLDK
jgi:hypothetical protein